jgi:hypothetical protein
MNLTQEQLIAKSQELQKRKTEYLALAPAIEYSSEEPTFSASPKSESELTTKAVAWFKGLPTKNKLMLVGGGIALAIHFFGSSEPKPVIPTPEPVATEQTTKATEQAEETAPEIDPQLANQRVLQSSIDQSTIYLADAVSLEQQKLIINQAQAYIRKLENKNQPLNTLLLGSIAQRQAKLRQATTKEYQELTYEIKALLVADALSVPSDNRSDSQRYVLEQFVPDALGVTGVELNPAPNAIALTVNSLGQQYQFLQNNSLDGLAKQELEQNEPK